MKLLIHFYTSTVAPLGYTQNKIVWPSEWILRLWTTHYILRIFQNVSKDPINKNHHWFSLWIAAEATNHHLWCIHVFDMRLVIGVFSLLGIMWVIHVFYKRLVNEVLSLLGILWCIYVFDRGLVIEVLNLLGILWNNMYLTKGYSSKCVVFLVVYMYTTEKMVIVGSENGLSSVQCHAVFQTNTSSFPVS